MELFTYCNEKGYRKMTLFFPGCQRPKEAQAGLLFSLPIPLKLPRWSNCVGRNSDPASKDYSHL